MKHTAIKQTSGTVVLKHVFLHDRAYRITTYHDTAAVDISVKRGKQYRHVRAVSDTADNYRAAVKRVHRMFERDSSAKLIASTLTKIVEAVDKPVTDEKIEPQLGGPVLTEKPKASRPSQATAERKQRLNEIQTSLFNAGQASFTLHTCVEGLTRTYMIRTSTKRLSGTTRSIPKATLSVILPYKNAPVATIKEFEGTYCVNKAIAHAEEDAETLVAAEFLIMLRVTKTGKAESTLQDCPYTVYVGKEETTAHMRQAFFQHVKRFFQKQRKE